MIYHWVQINSKKSSQVLVFIYFQDQLSQNYKTVISQEKILCPVSIPCAAIAIAVAAVVAAAAAAASAAASAVVVVADLDRSLADQHSIELSNTVKNGIDSLRLRTR